MNTIYIQTSSKEMIEAPIMDDIPIEAVSEFSTFGDLVPMIDQVVTLLTAYGSGKGQTSDTALLARGILDAPRWTKTNPVKITVDLHFYNKTSSLDDVITPMNTLLGLHLISMNENRTYKIPGFNAKNITALRDVIANKQSKKEDIVAATKALDLAFGGEERAETIMKSMEDTTISVLIPGIVYLPIAYIHSITPTYSKFITDAGYPLWATANVQIVSLSPAMFENFSNGSKVVSEKNIFGVTSLVNTDTGFII